MINGRDAPSRLTQLRYSGVQPFTSSPCFAMNLSNDMLHPRSRVIGRVSRRNGIQRRDVPGQTRNRACGCHPLVSSIYLKASPRPDQEPSSPAACSRSSLSRPGPSVSPSLSDRHRHRSPAAREATRCGAGEPRHASSVGGHIPRRARSSSMTSSSKDSKRGSGSRSACPAGS